MKTTYSIAKICRYDPRIRRLPSGDYDYDAEFESDDDNRIDCIPTLSLEPGKYSTAIHLPDFNPSCNVKGLLYCDLDSVKHYRESLLCSYLHHIQTKFMQV